MNISKRILGATYPVTLQKLAPLTATTATVLSFVGAPGIPTQLLLRMSAHPMTGATAGRFANALTSPMLARPATERHAERYDSLKRLELGIMVLLTIQHQIYLGR